MRSMLGGLLHFKYVVLDEAGAMLEPDMVGTVIHGCRFLLCVGDHKQVCGLRALPAVPCMRSLNTAAW